ncbi:MAG: hypothetical protein HY897_26070 [Deltaproteobacteria bacterium]|nr:hypothetical protein [Deltaproteobacteria bacterium]
MPYTEQDFVDIGSRFSTQRVIEQLQVMVAVVRAVLDVVRRVPGARGQAGVY